MQHTIEKVLNKNYNFVLDLILIKGLHTKLWAPKAPRGPTLRISGLPLGSPKTKLDLGASLMAKHKVYYKGEGGGFPQVWVVVTFVSSCLPVLHPYTKIVPTMH